MHIYLYIFVYIYQISASFWAMQLKLDWYIDPKHTNRLLIQILGQFDLSTSF